jgi:hypothetical protein
MHAMRLHAARPRRGKTRLRNFLRGGLCPLGAPSIPLCSISFPGAPSFSAFICLYRLVRSSRFFVVSGGKPAFKSTIQILKNRMAVLRYRDGPPWVHPMRTDPLLK